MERQLVSTQIEMPSFPVIAIGKRRVKPRTAWELRKTMHGEDYTYLVNTFRIVALNGLSKEHEPGV